MLNVILGVICGVALIAVFALGWHFGRRHRKRPNEIAVLAAKMGTPKVQGIDPTQPPPPAKQSFLDTYAKPTSLLDVAKEGVIALHESWRRKWHGQL
jgi:hypothetical protein